MSDDLNNILIFPQSRCRLGKQQIDYPSDEHGLGESELFLANLLHNIAEQYHLDPYYASQSISPFIPGLHSLVETVLHYCDSPHCKAEHLEVINQLLAETLINSFQHAQNLAYD